MNISDCVEHTFDPFMIGDSSSTTEPTPLAPAFPTYESCTNLAQLLAHVIQRSRTVPDVPETPPLTSEDVLQNIVICTVCELPLYADSHLATCRCSQDPCSPIPIAYLKYLVHNLVDGLASDLELKLAILRNIDHLWITTRETWRQELRQSSSCLDYWSDRLIDDDQLPAKFCEWRWDHYIQDCFALDEKLGKSPPNESIASIQARLKGWETTLQQVTKAERQRVIRLLIQEIRYDRATGKVSLVLQQPDWLPSSTAPDTCR